MAKTDLAERRKDISQAYAAILGDGELPAMADPELVTRLILERIQNADTFEEAFRPQSLRGWQELEGVTVKVLDFHLNPSGLQGQSVYAVVDLAVIEGGAGLAAGEKVTVTCGGKNVLMQLVKALERDWLEHPVTLVSKPTGQGDNKVLWLEAAGNPLDDV